MPDIEVNRVYCENCVETMGRMADDLIDLTVTSPPYDNIRSYNGFDFDYNSISKELFRVTKEGGVVVWIVGDAVVDGSETGTSFKQALCFMSNGFRLHDTMIYKKNGPAYPASDSSNRYSQVFEYMFVFSKGKPKSVNLLKDRKNRWAGVNTFGKQSHRGSDGELTDKVVRQTQDVGYRFNIWEYANGFGYSSKDELAFKHPAVFPEQLCADHIYSWSNVGDLVYDPFMGSGTTAKMAHIQKRNWLGSEISQEYCDLANKRIRPYLSQIVLI